MYFNCHANGSSVEWFINNSYPLPRSTYEAKGFTFIDMVITPRAANQLHEENNTIVVEANSSINNTRFKCRARGLYHSQYTDVDATMIVIGLFHRRSNLCHSKAKKYLILLTKRKIISIVFTLYNAGPPLAPPYNLTKVTHTCLLVMVVIATDLTFLCLHTTVLDKVKQ